MKYNYINISTDIFPGFYDSYLFNSDTLYWYNQNEKAPAGYEFDIKNFQEFEDKVSKKYVDVLYESLNDYDIIKGLKFVCVHSPRFYNFETDKLEIEVDFDEKKLEEYCLKQKREEFQTYLNDNFTSYSGFISFVPTNIPEFLESEYKWDVMIEFYLLNNVNDRWLDEDAWEITTNILYETVYLYKDGKWFDYEYDSETDSYLVGEEVED